MEFEITEGRKDPQAANVRPLATHSHTLLPAELPGVVGQQRTAHKASVCCMKADPVRLNRRPGSPRQRPVSFLDAQPVQTGGPAATGSLLSGRLG